MKNDMDALLNSVFGSRSVGARLSTKGSGSAKPTSGSKATNVSTEELLQAMDETNRRINEQLSRQSEILRERTAQRHTQSIEELCDNARRDVDDLQKRMESDGLAAPAVRKSPYEENPAIFTEIEREAKKTVFGQDELLHRFTLSMKRPFATGRDEGHAENTVLICGAAHSGRHTAVNRVLSLMRERALIPNEDAAVIDLAEYPSQGEEKLFLQDLYMALHAKSPIVIFENLEDCNAAFVNSLRELCDEGVYRLSTRYTMQQGRLLDAGTALVTDAVSTLSAEGKYLIFFSALKKSKVADSFGSPFLSAMGDICEAAVLDDAALGQIAAAQVELLKSESAKRLSLVLTCDDTVAQQLAADAQPQSGAEEIIKAEDTLFDALSEWKLEQDLPANTAVTLTAAPAWTLTIAGATAPLAPYLPQTYRGALDEVKRELDNIVGLKEIKEYILSLEDHYAVQARRRAEGMQTAAVSMHMIFTGNPGTGKTTIARIVSRYLKAVGVLSGGQLVEVTRADLVGRYVGHTAPLTRSVIESALGGVLFIDEAYSLYRGEQDSFGLEAIDTLVKGIEDHRENLLVILAGYSREMQEFLQSNSGLKSRFPNVIEFPDYTGEELLAIAKINAKSRGYRFADDVEKPLLEFFNRAQEQNARENGNGRLARNKLEEAIVNQSRRLIAQPDDALDVLCAEDFEFDTV